MTALLELRGIVKRFPGVTALDGVDLDITAGEVHCLLGQNGAGKSTLIRILAGAHQPDAGEIHWQGGPTTFPHPLAALRTGIATIYQELDLVDDLSVAENIFLGREPNSGGFVRRGDLNRRAAEVLARLGHADIPVRRPVGKLPTAAKQVVSMARALSADARLIIMDEPSAVLAHDEVANLFRLIRELTEHGVAILYISHRLDEIREIGDRVTVLKDGRTAAANLPARTTPHRELVSRMTGRTIEYLIPPREGAVDPAAPVVLEVTGLSRAGEFADVSLTVHSGEIVGLAGLVGSGRTEVLETIYGARTADAGTVRVDGRPLRRGDVAAAVRAGLGMAPEERKSQALLLQEPIWRNVTLATMSRYAHAGFTDDSAAIGAARTVTASLALHPGDVRRRAATLSGGNQQKVVLARWLSAGSLRVLLLDEPTRGVDVGARTDLYGVIRRLAAQGVAVLLVSSEVPEVLGLADRVLVLREGRVVHEGPADALDEHRVLDLVMSTVEEQ